MPPEPEQIQPLAQTQTADTAPDAEQIRQQTEQQRAEGRSERNLQSLIDGLFSAPTSGQPGEMSSEGATREYRELMRNKNYKTRVEIVQMKIRTVMQRAGRLIAERASEQEAHEKTKTGLAALKNRILTMGQAFKTRETKYRVEGQPPSTETPVSVSEVFETAELMAFQHTLEMLEKLTPEEMLDMATERADFTTMLIELKDLSNDQMGTLEKAGVTKHDRIDGEIVKKLHPRNPKFRENLDKVREFILSAKTDTRSKERRGLDTDLWMEILRSMNQEQRLFLFQNFVEHNQERKALGILLLLAKQGVMTKEEVLAVINHEKLKKYFENEYQKDSKKFSRGGDSFAAMVDAQVAEFKKQTESDSAIIRSLEKPSIDSAANYFLSFDNLIMSRVAEIGALTSAINVIGSIGDEIKGRQDKSWKGLAAAVGKGVVGAAQNVYVLGGAAVATGATAYVLRDLIDWDAPGTREQEFLRDKEGRAWARSEAKAHPRLPNFVSQRYELLFTKAKENRDSDKDKRGIRLFREDIKLSEREIAELGYTQDPETKKSAEEVAKNAIMKMFLVLHSHDIETADQAADFFPKYEIV